MYRTNLQTEAKLEKIQLKGKWFYRCSKHLKPDGRFDPYRKDDD